MGAPPFKVGTEEEEGRGDPLVFSSCSNMPSSLPFALLSPLVIRGFRKSSIPSKASDPGLARPARTAGSGGMTTFSCGASGPLCVLSGTSRPARRLRLRILRFQRLRKYMVKPMIHAMAMSPPQTEPAIMGVLASPLSMVSPAMRNFYVRRTRRERERSTRMADSLAQLGIRLVLDC